MRRRAMTMWLGAAVGLAAAVTGRAQEAPLILAPVFAGARTTHTWLTNYVSPQYMIDNSGMTGLGRDATHTNANVKWLFWHSAGTVSNEWVEFDLGAPYRVTNALIWQLAQAGMTDRGVQSFSILVAGADKAYATLSASNTLAQATAAATTPAQVVPLVADNVRWIRFNIHTNWGAADIVGLSEVRFEAYPMPEEPPAVRLVVPNAATASTTYNSGYAPIYMIDNSGMTGAGRDATHTNRNATGLFWHSNTGIIVSNQWVEFDLLMTYDLTNALIWQLAQSGLTTRGVKGFTIKTAGEDRVFATHSAAQLAQATGAANEPVQVVPLAAQNVRYVRFEIQSNWGASGIVGLSEVRFEATRVSLNTAGRTLTPLAATVSTTYSDAAYGARYMIDNSGMTGKDREATHVNRNATGLFWHSNTGTVHAAQWAEFDLGNRFDLSGALVWQLAQSNMTSRGVKEVTLQTAGPDRVFSAVAVSNVLRRALGVFEEPVQVVPLVAENARYVRFDIHSNWGGDVVGLSEVRFEGQPKTNGTLRAQVACEVSSAAAAYPREALLDGSGLSGAGLGATHTNGLGAGSMWLSGFGAVTNEWVAFDFGWEIDLVAAAVWPYNQTAYADGSLALGALKRGVKRITVYVAGGDQNYTEFAVANLDQGGGLANQAAQFVGLQTNRVRYVKFAVNSNWGDPNYVGLGEVRFVYTRYDGTLIRVK